MDDDKAVKKAVRLAIECIRREIQRLAVDANLQEMYQANLPHTIAASKRRALLREAIAVLKGQPGEPSKKTRSAREKSEMAETQPDLFVATGTEN